MRRIKIETTVRDDFESGYCHGCPFAYEEEYWEDDYLECDEHCVLGKPYWQCPIEFVDEE